MDHPQNEEELRKWFADNPNLDPKKNPNITTKWSDKRTYELHTYTNSETGESKTIQWPCGPGVCPGCKGILCRSSNPN